ncbi:uncharacterized protein DDB_G0286299-like [Artemia franciscana]|uniref:uncharacterized protein DDB_G0286299-like n=1 Tax=Artemia franciscana TaxID=6661 RepID=UPI0032DAFE7E
MKLLILLSIVAVSLPLVRLVPLDEPNSDINAVGEYADDGKIQTNNNELNEIPADPETLKEVADKEADPALPVEGDESSGNSMSVESDSVSELEDEEDVEGRTKRAVNRKVQQKKNQQRKQQQKRRPKQPVRNQRRPNRNRNQVEKGCPREGDIELPDENDVTKMQGDEPVEQRTNDETDAVQDAEGRRANKRGQPANRNRKNKRCTPNKLNRKQQIRRAQIKNNKLNRKQQIRRGQIKNKQRRQAQLKRKQNKKGARPREGDIPLEDVSVQAA